MNPASGLNFVIPIYMKITKHFIFHLTQAAFFIELGFMGALGRFERVYINEKESKLFNSSFSIGITKFGCFQQRLNL